MSSLSVAAPEFDPRVVQGIALLDAKADPNWRSMIDLGLLDIARADRCILGQLYGDYYEGLEAIGLSKSQAEKKASFIEQDVQG